MQPIFCISDLHLCDRGHRDNFFARGEDRLHRFLDYVEKEGATLYILGDLIEAYQANFSVVVKAYKSLFRRLAYSDTIYIAGNHDDTHTAFLNCSDCSEWFPDWFPLPQLPFTIHSGDKIIAFAHGHEFDNACKDLNPGIGALTAIMSAMLEDKNKGPVKDGEIIEDEFIGALEWPLNLWRSITNQAKRDREMLKKAEEYRIEKQADYLVFGHTHIQGRFKNCFNCGTWARERDGFTRIENGSISMWTWNDNHTEPFYKEL